MAGERGGFVSNAFHQIAVRADAVDEMVDDREALAVELRFQVLLRDPHADAVREPLPERPGRYLDARRQNVFRMPRRFRMKLAETLQLIHRADRSPSNAAASKAASSRGPPTAETGRGRTISGSSGCAEEFCPQHIRRRSHSERQARMAGFRLLHRVERKRADSVDAKLVEIGSSLGFGCGCHKSNGSE